MRFIFAESAIRAPSYVRTDALAAEGVRRVLVSFFFTRTWPEALLVNWVNNGQARP